MLPQLNGQSIGFQIRRLRVSPRAARPKGVRGQANRARLKGTAWGAANLIERSDVGTGHNYAVGISFNPKQE